MSRKRAGPHHCDLQAWVAEWEEELEEVVGVRQALEEDLDVLLGTKDLPRASALQWEEAESPGGWGGLDEEVGL